MFDNLVNQDAKFNISFPSHLEFYVLKKYIFMLAINLNYSLDILLLDVKIKVIILQLFLLHLDYKVHKVLNLLLYLCIIQ